MSNSQRSLFLPLFEQQRGVNLRFSILTVLNSNNIHLPLQKIRKQLLYRIAIKNNQFLRLKKLDTICAQT